jgi:type VI protein secretion system component VasK
VTRPAIGKEGFSLLGVAAVACIACCAAPILGVVGGITLAGLASTVVVGSAGLVVAVIAGLAWLIVRRTRPAHARSNDADKPISVGPPTRKR